MMKNRTVTMHTSLTIVPVKSSDPMMSRMLPTTKRAQAYMIDFRGTLTSGMTNCVGMWDKWA